MLWKSVPNNIAAFCCSKVTATRYRTTRVHRAFTVQYKTSTYLEPWAFSLAKFEYSVLCIPDIVEKVYTFKLSVKV